MSRMSHILKKKPVHHGDNGIFLTGHAEAEKEGTEQNMSTMRHKQAENVQQKSIFAENCVLHRKHHVKNGKKRKRNNINKKEEPHRTCISSDKQKKCDKRLTYNEGCAILRPLKPLFFSRPYMHHDGQSFFSLSSRSSFSQKFPLICTLHRKGEDIDEDLLSSRRRQDG